MALLIPNVTWTEHVEEATLVARHLGLHPSAISSAQLVRRSLDARQRQPRWVGVFRVELPDEASILARGLPGVRPWIPRDDGRYGLDAEAPPRRRFDPAVRPIVVGAGPAGLFAALYLAESGAPVRLLDRGGPVEERIEAVNGFWRGRAPLDPENNLVFGEGGAGTFSDGKIYTRRRDGELGYIFQKLIAFGADPEAIAESWAHLGTDRIRALLPPFRRRLQELGVELGYHQRVVDLVIDRGRAVGVKLADGRVIEGGPVLIATGHSARDAIEMMIRAGAEAAPRGIAIGARVEHPQALIDRARYGGRDQGELPPASYRLAFNPTNAPAARTFCMCPGGMVVPAMNHPERVVVNGMSFAARRAFWSNSAVIVEIDPRTYGADDPLAGFRWQDAIEQAAFAAGGGTYAAPAQRVADFLVDRPSQQVPRTSYPLGVVPGDLRAVLPDPIVRAMQAALVAFEGKLEGFAGGDGVLIAPETRTTSPVRFRRDARGCSTVADLYPVGEGAGFAGGIVSSALDGLSAARAICAEAGLA